jgi:hypothetical protein
MIHKHKSLISNLLICICTAGFVHGSDPVEDVMSLVEKTVADPNVGWSLECQMEYIDSIKKAFGENHNDTNYTTKIEIIRSAFPEYWDNYKMSKLNQIEFEMCKVEIRWYCQTLIENEPDWYFLPACSSMWGFSHHF